jgi:hypothetical protein
MFRVGHRDEELDDSNTIEGTRQIDQGEPPGRYDVDEIRAKPFPSGQTSRQWGRLIRHRDGRVEDEPHPWRDQSMT